MRMKLSDYVSNFFAEHGIHTVFTVVGGGAMHLNHSFGHDPRIQCVYNHHEQASAMAAEAYFRVNNQMAGVCVTSGPGAINALNGVIGAYQDSIPILVVSGQAKSTLTVRKTGIDVRTLGPQEFDILSTLKYGAKYAESVMKADDIRYCLEKAYDVALSGRPGPAWLEIPVDIQGTYVDTDVLRGYSSEEYDGMPEWEADIKNDISQVIGKLINAKRPVIYAGNGVRIAEAVDLLRALSEQYRIPVVTCWDSIDVMFTDSGVYAGRAGLMGDRAGNFTIQNADLVLAIGNRLNTYQVGYNIDSWAREAYIIDVDIDKKELMKPTIRVDLPICCDAKRFLKELYQHLNNESFICDHKWLRTCIKWKEKYPVVTKRHFDQKEKVNIYAFIDIFSKCLPEDMITVVANGSASVVGSAAYFIKKESRFLMNCALSSMGYDLPAAIGACVANEKHPVVCIAGDGSIMMNLQELQTIVTNNLPIKLVVINNAGYHQIRLTQTNLFQGEFVGIGPQSGDLNFPSFSKIAYAFGIPYMECRCNDEIQHVVEKFLSYQRSVLLEIFTDTEQTFEPKSATKRREDGSLASPPLEDMAPFLSRSELEENMLIDLWKE